MIVPGGRVCVLVLREVSTFGITFAPIQVRHDTLVLVEVELKPVSNAKATVRRKRSARDVLQCIALFMYLDVKGTADKSYCYICVQPLRSI